MVCPCKRGTCNIKHQCYLKRNTAALIGKIVEKQSRDLDYYVMFYMTVNMPILQAYVWKAVSL